MLQSDRDLVAAIDALLQNDHQPQRITSSSADDASPWATLAALINDGESAHPSNLQTDESIDYASLLANPSSDVSVGGNEAFSSLNAFGMPIGSNSDNSQEKLSNFLKQLYPTLSDEERNALLVGSSIPVGVVGLGSGRSTPTQPASKDPTIGMPKQRGNDEYDDIETDGELELEEEGESSALPSKVPTANTIISSDEKRKPISLAQLTNASHVDPNTALLLAGLENSAIGGKVYSLVLGCDNAPANDGPTKRLNSFVVESPVVDETATDECEVDNLANLITFGQCKPGAQRPRQLQPRARDHKPFQHSPPPPPPSAPPAAMETEAEDLEVPQLPDASPDINQTQSTYHTRFSEMYSDLKAVVDEVEDTVQPMTLDPSFDYEANLFGFTTRFGELVKREGNKVPQAICFAYHHQDGHEPSDDKPTTHNQLPPNSFTKDSRFANLFLDDPFSEKPIATSSSDAACQDVVGTVSYQCSAVVCAPGGDLSEHNQLVGGAGVDSANDAEEGADLRSFESLVGGVDEKNVDNEKTVQMIMRWAKEQK